jgi:hypothetical protein
LGIYLLTVISIKVTSDELCRIQLPMIAELKDHLKYAYISYTYMRYGFLIVSETEALMSSMIIVGAIIKSNISTL